MFRRQTLLALLASFILCATASAQPVQRERVHFPRGHSDATITDHVTGRGSIEFLLGARAGQVLQVRIAGSSNVAFSTKEVTAVTERIGSDIEDSHDKSALATLVLGKY